MHHRQSLGRAALAAVLLSLVLVVAAAAPGAGGKSSRSPRRSSRSPTPPGRSSTRSCAPSWRRAPRSASSSMRRSKSTLQRRCRRVHAQRPVRECGRHLAGSRLAARAPGDEARGTARGHLGEARPAEADSFSARDPRAQPEPDTFEVVPTVVHERPAGEGSAVLGRARPAGRQLRPAEAARRPRCQDAQVRRRLEPGLRRRRHDRQHPRRRHRLGASRPPEHVADVVGRD